MAALTEQRRTDDLLRQMFSADYCLESAPLSSGAVAVPANTNLVGYPLKFTSPNYIVMTAAEVTAAAATDKIYMVVDDKESGPSAVTGVFPGKRAVLVRGPATVHKDFLRTTDLAGASYNSAKVQAGLLNSGIVTVDEVGLVATI